MKIAITADVHLTSYDKNPERYNALENILVQLVNQNIEHIIIAGDLFDASCNDPADFETLVGKDKYRELFVYIIPGNHDPALSDGTFTLPNIKYLTDPLCLPLSDEVPFLFMPYRPRKTIGEILAANQEKFDRNNFILIAHGDYLSSTTLRNDYEEGYYMPLSRRDIEIYRPEKVFLGHIHLPYDSEILHYPGSPCGLDIKETGIRSFLIYDTSTEKVTRQPIETDVLYFQELLTILPLDDEVTYLMNILKQRISSWRLNEAQKKVVKARIKVQGYSSNRDLVQKTITNYLAQENIALNDPVDLNKVKISDDVMRADIILSVQKRFFELGLPENIDEPGVDDYILSAMNQVYGD